MRFIGEFVNQYVQHKKKCKYCIHLLILLYDFLLLKKRIDGTPNLTIRYCHLVYIMYVRPHMHYFLSQFFMPLWSVEIALQRLQFRKNSQTRKATEKYDSIFVLLFCNFLFLFRQLHMYIALLRIK